MCVSSTGHFCNRGDEIFIEEHSKVTTRHTTFNLSQGRRKNSAERQLFMNKGKV